MDDDFRALTLVSAWQSGLWVKPIKEEDCSSDEHQGQLQAQKDVADETGFDVPFYALWAFKMVGNEWRIREQTEVRRTPALPHPHNATAAQTRRPCTQQPSVKHNPCGLGHAHERHQQGEAQSPRRPQDSLHSFMIAAKSFPA
jgi:hypothetical protein